MNYRKDLEAIKTAETLLDGIQSEDLKYEKWDIFKITARMKNYCYIAIGKETEKEEEDTEFNDD